jgi:hypothetical protein
MALAIAMSIMGLPASPLRANTGMRVLVHCAPLQDVNLVWQFEEMREPMTIAVSMIGGNKASSP